MSKALEILKKRKRTLLLIKASSVLTKKESIEIDGDIKEFDEAIAELEAQEAKSCINFEKDKKVIREKICSIFSKANEKYGQFMPQQYVSIFLDICEENGITFEKPTK